MDFRAHETRLRTLIQGVREEESDAVLDACIAAGHRQHFFVPCGRDLRKRGQTIFEKIEEHQLQPARGKAGKGQWQALGEGRPISLSRILKIDAALTAFANHADATVRAVTAVAGASLTLPSDSVIESIYWANPDEFQKFRTRVSDKGREKLSSEIFGPGHHNTLALIERGEKDNDVRITFATIERMKEALGDDVGDLFSCDAALGKRGGENTIALKASQGNFLSYVRGARAGTANKV